LLKFYFYLKKMRRKGTKKEIIEKAGFCK